MGRVVPERTSTTPSKIVLVLVIESRGSQTLRRSRNLRKGLRFVRDLARKKWPAAAGNRPRRQVLPPWRIPSPVNGTASGRAAISTLHVAKTGTGDAFGRFVLSASAEARSSRARTVAHGKVECKPKFVLAVTGQLWVG